MGLIEAISNLILGEQGTKGEWKKESRYNSFASEREECHAKWFVDAKDYYYAVSEALMDAKEEILIEDLWLSPELYLRRPPAKNEQYRLDRILKKKAEEGVKIYVVLYKDIPKVANYDSRHGKDVLQGLHENIIVQRHPDHDPVTGTFFWTHHEKIVIVDRHVSFIGGLDLCFGRYDTTAHQLTDFHKSSNHYSVWPGQDYSNPRIKDFFDLPNWAKVLIDKKRLARMPWHDIALGFVGRPTLDITRHFIQRWNFIKKKKAEGRSQYPVMIAKSDQQHDREYPPQVRSYHCNGITVNCHPYKGTCNVQILRSCGKWSHGLDEVEHSIRNAYIKTIEEAKHFIYIENQFFATATKEGTKYPVKNLIGKAIVDRIVRAHKNHEKFRIIVVMPLLPAFPADLDSPDAGTVRLVINFQYKSICRGGSSILDTLRKNGVTDPGKYIGFYSLRNYDKIDPQAVKKGLGILKDELESSGEIPQAVGDESSFGTYITEELYIHSKLLIADDRIVICGSANLNDRSQNGECDSEIAAIIEDQNYIDSKMGGENWKAGKFAATLRRHIFKEHLGLLIESDHEKVTSTCYPPPLPFDDQELSKNDHIVIDPIGIEFTHDVWERTAIVNTEAFRTVFHCVPDDTVTNWNEYKAFIPNRLKVPTGHVYDTEELTKEVVEVELSRIKGHLVHYPLQFMNREELEGTAIDPVIPMEIFT